MAHVYHPKIINLKSLSMNKALIIVCTVLIYMSNYSQYNPVNWNTKLNDSSIVFEAEIEKGLLSYRSPVAKSLIGKEKGDFVTVTTPKGEKNYEIKKITYE